MKLFVIALCLTMMSLARAETPADQNSAQAQHQLSKRPYAVAPAKKPDVLEGDTADMQEVKDKHYKTLNLHQLGKRPYAEKNTD